MVRRAGDCIDVRRVHLHGTCRAMYITVTDLRCQVVSSIIAAWSDVAATLSDSTPSSLGVSLDSLRSMTGAVQQLNIGYFWMLVNCLTSAAYVSDLDPRRC